ncbi:MAG: dicarboxylate/amino acid:cation symporter [Gemmatimonadaceae bacterium]|nr:dicarboxylate/amino acid:cation symporter [Gemmatimonadaceae bacterium]
MQSPAPARGRRFPLAAQVLLGLILGFAVGLALPALGDTAMRAGIAIAEPVGALFVNAIRMTVIPLVVASLVVAVATAPDPRVVGAIGGRSIAFFLGIVLAGAAFAALLAPPLLALSPMGADAATALRGSTATATVAPAATPTIGQWIVDLVPANPFKAASDGAMLPLIVFALSLGFALPRIARVRGEPVIRFFEGISDAMILVVRWVLAFAPLGVFALAVPLASRAGGSAAGALVSYVVVSAALMVAFALLVLYPLAAIGGRVSPARFTRGCLPPQAVAFGSRSSLAALPAMIESARDRLALPPAITGFFLPLSTATFRAGSAVQQTVAVIFAAHLFGVGLGAAQLATVAVTVALTTFGIPAIPGGSILVLAPVLVAAHVPAEAVGVLLALDTVPDMFRTTVNVTGHMSVAAVLGRGTRAIVAEGT